MLLAVLGALFAEPGRRKMVTVLFLLMALAMVVYNLSPLVSDPLARWGRQLPGVNWPKLAARLISFVQVFTQLNLAILGYTFMTMGIFAVMHVRQPVRMVVAFVVWLCSGASLVFYGESLTLVGTPYIIIAAFAVRSLPASVRSGVASLQQIDLSIEEASTILGGDAQITFRRPLHFR